MGPVPGMHLMEERDGRDNHRKALIGQQFAEAGVDHGQSEAALPIKAGSALAQHRAQFVAVQEHSPRADRASGRGQSALARA